MKMKTRRRKAPVTASFASGSLGKGAGRLTRFASSANPLTSARLIRQFHVLLKQRTQLEKKQTSPENVQALADVDEEIAGLGGLETYQRMSAIGQGTDRGGGSERVFVEWLKELAIKDEKMKGKGKMRLLEVGALKPDNYANFGAWIDTHPIDLRSRHPLIAEQDFLRMDQEKHACAWDAVSLSLVVNFVPEPRDRGRMLRYAYNMLHDDGLLFLALPLPCVSNSRYLTFERLESLMRHIGFEPLRERWKAGGKMVYWLFSKRTQRGSSIPAQDEMRSAHFDKKVSLAFRAQAVVELCSLLDHVRRRARAGALTRRRRRPRTPRAPRVRPTACSCPSPFFSSVFGYSVSEWMRRGAGGTKEANAGLRTWQTVTYGSRADVEAAITELRKVLPDEGAVNTEPAILQSYGFSETSYHPSMPHAVVVRPKTTEDVSEVVKIANKYKVPVTAYGAGTSLEGQFSGCSTGSICIDMDGMNKILQDDGDLICQAGARWEDVNETLKEKGIPLFFPLDPGPGATIGGMIGTGCSGTNAVRYGTAKGEWFLNITVVLPDGEVIKTRKRARKSSAGFDTTKLFVGAEGTLGIVTEATLKLAPRLPTKVALAQFPDVQHAVNAVQEILRSSYGNFIQCVELVDDFSISAINKSGSIGQEYPIRDSLFFKIQGNDDAVKATAKLIQAVVKRHGSKMFQFAETDDEADALWEARKYVLMSVIASEEGARAWTTDVCVPVSKLPQLVQETKEDITHSGLKAGVLGHVGDGNFHALILFHDDAELQKVSECVHRLVYRALALDGTCTGEHGVGVGKKEYLVDELGPGTVELMKRVKDAIDPNHIMNPGKRLALRLKIRASGNDDHIPPPRDIAEFAHSQGVKIAASFEHNGRPDEVYGPSAIPYNDVFPKPNALTKEGIKRVVRGFVDAAKRSLKAGVDVIEIHNAHGYLLHEFVSPISNKRTDEYGGSFENRIRLTVQVVDAIRGIIPKDMPLFLRISATDWLEESLPNEPSWTIKETVKLSETLSAHGVDLIDVSSAGNHPQQRIISGTAANFAYQAQLAHEIKKAHGIDTPRGLLVGAVGEINTGPIAEEVLDLGMSDIVLVGRQFQKDSASVLTFAEQLGVRIKVAGSRTRY
ncbi:hypothetical protein EW145_g4198 [Phellinidium pouzarii]|uniref:25S rRNA adenine-N(1) methyltransferase n=1 Tax=Phellinidium pouzarii TaxID=167371 RepID=A0A4S4L4C0_9AGAM|nr:hypothetical protein EW145_g4198 [Phellinidium pouzarii]